MSAAVTTALGVTLLISKCHASVTEVTRSLDIKILLLKSVTLNPQACHFRDTSQNNLSRLFSLKSSHIFAPVTLVTLFLYISRIESKNIYKNTSKKTYIYTYRKVLSQVSRPNYLPLDRSVA